MGCAQKKEGGAAYLIYRRKWFSLLGTGKRIFTGTYFYSYSKKEGNRIGGGVNADGKLPRYLQKGEKGSSVRRRRMIAAS